MFSNACRVLPHCNTQLRLLYLLIKKSPYLEIGNSTKFIQCMQTFITDRKSDLSTSCHNDWVCTDVCTYRLATELTYKISKIDPTLKGFEGSSELPPPPPG